MREGMSLVLIVLSMGGKCGIGTLAIPCVKAA